MWGSDLASARRRVQFLEGLIKSTKGLGKTPSAETKKLLRDAREEVAKLEAEQS